MKVLQQSNGHLYKGPYDCFKKTVKQYGFLSLYRGLTSPLIGSVVENAIVFSFNGGMKDFLAVDEQRNTLTQPNPLWKYFAAGAFAGIGTAFILTPVELVKCKLQVEQAGPSSTTALGSTTSISSSNENVVSRKSGPIQIVGDILRTEGIKGLFRGQVSCLMREVPGNGTWFGVYELCRYQWQKYLGIERKGDLPLVYSALSGSVAGMAYWAVPFPADTVKTKLQTDPRYFGLSFTSAFRKALNEEGAKGMYRGLGVTLTRAAPAHFVIFIVYEWISKTLLRVEY